MKLFLLQLFVSCLASACVLNIKDFGARGDGVHIDTKAIQKAIASTPSSHCTILVPAPGTYLTGAINLTSHLTLRIEPGATLLGVADRTHFPIIPPLPSYGKCRDVGTGFARHQALLYCLGCTDVRITGGGTIDGNGAYWWTLWRRRALSAGRPRLIEWQDSCRIELDGLTLRNAAFWTVHPVYCADVWIHDLSIENPPDSPNTDGIDPDSSEGVLIERCRISCGDDHVAIKSGMGRAGFEFNRPCKNVTVRDSLLLSGDGICIGSETSGGGGHLPA
eukprot:gnl/Trimastix_PCT/4129.p1 GENE.gnl/Trimastix_PCT/4129~~gnl/Trimastix_PCT/4129.p1  ORF type:complete len:296 (-),score=19.86 gnl/Trimastix_PCT/4129:44-874(-)